MTIRTEIATDGGTVRMGRGLIFFSVSKTDATGKRVAANIFMHDSGASGGAARSAADAYFAGLL